MPSADIAPMLGACRADPARPSLRRAAQARRGRLPATNLRHCPSYPVCGGPGLPAFRASRRASGVTAAERQRRGWRAPWRRRVRPVKGRLEDVQKL